MNDNEVEALKLQGWPLPDEFLVEIGRVSSLWSSLEDLLNLCIGRLAGYNDLNDPTPFILFNHASLPQRLDILATLCEQLAPFTPHLADYKATVKALQTAQRDRNKFAHNSPVLDEKTGHVFLATGTARGSLKTNVEKISVADIRRAAISVDNAFRSLYKLIFERDIPPAEERYKA